MDINKHLDRDDIILTQSDRDWRSQLEHLGCRNCGQEYYTRPRRLAILGCSACGQHPDEWDGEQPLFKPLDV